MSIKNELVPRFSAARSAPILFAGAGFSRRYLGSPDWKTLLEYFADLTDKSYAYYRTKANDSLPRIGSLIAEEFHEVWFSDSAYVKSRENFQDKCSRISDPLKYEICNYLSNYSKVIAYESEIASLKTISLEAVITTNYDSLLESIFETYEVFSNQDALILGQVYGAGEIYKVHGSLEDPSSLILTTEDYSFFEERNVILAAKLLTLIVEHPIVFLGYSLSDENVKTILSSIVRCLNPSGMKMIQDSIYIVEWQPGREESVTAGTIRISDIDLPYTHISCTEFQSIYESMASFERRFPVKMLRALKKSVYQLIEESDPKGKLLVLDIDDPNDFENADYVIGIGVHDKLNSVGYTGLQRDDLFRYLLHGGDYDAQQILEKTVPQYAKGNASCPIFRFLREAGKINDEQLDTEGLASVVVNLSKADIETYKHKSYKNQESQVNSSFDSLDELLTLYDVNTAAYRIALLEPLKIDLELLRDFLSKNWEAVRASGGGQISNFRKLACFYDFLRYGVHGHHSLQSHTK